MFVDEVQVPVEDVKANLRKFLSRLKRKELYREAAALVTSSRILRGRRRVHSLGLADRCVTAPLRYVTNILTYRKGKFLAGRKCLCGDTFYPSYEENCDRIAGKRRLDRREWKVKVEMEIHLSRLR
jgi:hypothetical protein